MQLQYPAKCDECGKVMRPGTTVNYFKDGARYGYVHEGECPKKPKGAPPVQPQSDRRWTFRYCSANFLHDLAYDRHQDVPAKCPSCGAAWRDDCEVAA